MNLLPALLILASAWQASAAGGFLAGPYLRDVTDASAMVSWETAEPVDGTLYYGTSPGRYTAQVSVPPASMQRVNLTGLQPGTMYYYRVVADNCSTPSGDPRYSFRTGHPGAEPFEFAVYADTNSGRNGSDLDHGKVVRSAAGFRPSFVVVTGDLVANGRSKEDWLRFLQVEEDLIRGAPIFATMGNNDTSGKEFFHEYFISPRPSSWYSFDYGGCHFIFLDILRGQGDKYYGGFRPGNPQITWLLEDLQSPANRNAKFTMVFFHAPVFAPDGTGNKVLAEMLHPLFLKYGVDVVFNGTHSFTRAEKDGIPYVISGGGGAEILPVRPAKVPEIKETAFLLHHLRVKVNYPAIDFSVVDTNGTVVSSFAYWDPRALHGRAALVEGSPGPDAGGGEATGSRGLSVKVFSLPDCGYCQTLLKKVIPGIARDAAHELDVAYYPLDDADNLERMIAIEELLGDTDNELPAVVIDGQVILGGKAEIEKDLRKTILLAARGWRAGTTAREDGLGEARNILLDRFRSFGVLPVIAAGLLDGVNPCAFTTIIFLLSYLVYLGKRKRELLVAGGFFSAGVFLAYTGLGLGLSRILQSFSAIQTLAVIIKYVTFAGLVILSVLSFYDYALCRQGKTTRMSLQLPRFLKQRIHASVRTRTRSAGLIVSSLGLGFVVSVLELACTGQVYLPTIVYMLKVATEARRAFALLLTYNLAFILPLVVVFVLAYFGLTAETLAKAFERRIGAMKLATGILFLALGALVLVF